MKIVIIDDEPKIRKGLSKIVSMHPAWHVTGAFGDAKSALSFLHENEADVIITDIHMPDMTGLELIERLFHSGKNPAIVILSGYGKFEYAKKAIDFGVKKYLMKPTSPEEVTAALEQIEEERGLATHTSAFMAPTHNLMVLRAKEYIELHYREKFTLKDVAASLYISPNYLSELFKKNTGMKFSDYLTEVRLEKAKAYLKDVHYRVGEVSSLVGFSDARYFSNTFKKKYGATPMEYRNRHCT